jgi:adenosylcobinamide-GDP ribazoletransferase
VKTKNIKKYPKGIAAFASGLKAAEAVKQIVLSFLVALQFLTTLPIPISKSPDGQDVGRSVRYFPAVGLILGILLCLINKLLSLVLNPNMTDLLTIIALLILTGALHLDGFLDSCDGLFGYRSAERRLEIMRDSRVGSFGVAGGWALLTLKYMALLNVPPELKTGALLLAPMLGRWALVNAVVLFPYGRESGLGTIYKQYTTRRELFLATLAILLITVLVLKIAGIIISLLIFGSTMLMAKWIMTKLPAGLTGDTYGFITEVCEMLVWLIIGAATSWVK